MHRTRPYGTLSAVPASYLLRLRLPDRPGTLGAVATALGTVDADIVSLDVIERGLDCATDDIVVELPEGALPDTIVTAAATITGVVVESIRTYSGPFDVHRELALLDRLGSEPGRYLEVLADGVAKVFRAGWALVLDAPVGGHGRVLAAGGAAPEVESLPMPWWPPTPSRPLDADGEWAPAGWDRMAGELAVTALGDYALLVGRPAPSWAASELVRLQHLAAIAASVAAVTT